ncbi:MAG: Ig-like domain-containing protein [Acidobacteriota bacterium]
MAKVIKLHVPVKGVQIVENSLSLYTAGLGDFLTAAVHPSNASKKDITWKSSNSSVATVSPGGWITPVGKGSSIITATTVDGGFSESRPVYVDYDYIPVIGVSITPRSLNLVNSWAMEQRLYYTLTPVNASVPFVSWSSSDPSVATVSSNGTVQPMKPGVTIISVRTKDGGFTDTCKVTITPFPLRSISLDRNNIVIQVGETGSPLVYAWTPYAANPDLIWTSTDPEVADLDFSLVNQTMVIQEPRDKKKFYTFNDKCCRLGPNVIPKGPGRAIVTVSTENGQFVDSCEIIVAPAIIPVTGVALNVNQLEVSVGDEPFSLTAAVYPEDASEQDVIWDSSAPEVALVVDGFIKPMAPGKAVITATTVDGGYADSCFVNIVPAVIRVTGVSLNIREIEATVGDEILTLVASIFPTDASEQGLVWETSSEDVTMVENGVILALTPGQSVISVTTIDGSFSDTCLVNVVPEYIAVTGVTLDKKKVEAKTGDESILLQAEIHPPEATKRTLTWSSSNDLAVRVKDGVLTPVAAGKSVITVTAVDGGFTDSCEIIVTKAFIAVRGVKLNKAVLEVTAGDKPIALEATVFPENATMKGLVWSSSDESLVQVGNGLVLPLSPGHAVITVATVDGDFTDTCKVIVEQERLAVKAVKLNINELEIIRGEGTWQLDAVIYPEYAYEQGLIWASSNEAVVTVNQGVITPHAGGTAVITVTTVDGGFSDKCEVTILQERVMVSGISLNKHRLDLIEGKGEAILAAEVLPPNAENKTVLWDSSNEEVAEVHSGVVFPLSPGRAVIAAVTEDGRFMDECEVFVEEFIPVRKVHIDPDSKALNSKQPFVALEAWLDPEYATNQVITWKSSNEEVARVDKDGMVRAVAKGKAIITAAADEGLVTAECKITVSSITPVKGVELNHELMVVEPGAALVPLRAMVYPRSATNRSVIWSSSNPEVAAMEDNKLVIRVHNGETNIIVTTEEGGFSATCKVIVKLK